MVALAPRCTRLRAGFVIHRKTDFPIGPQAKPAALFFFASDGNGSEREETRCCSPLKTNSNDWRLRDSTSSRFSRRSPPTSRLPSPPSSKSRAATTPSCSKASAAARNGAATPFSAPILSSSCARARTAWTSSGPAAASRCARSRTPSRSCAPRSSASALPSCPTCRASSAARSDFSRTTSCDASRRFPKPPPTISALPIST